MFKKARGKIKHFKQRPGRYKIDPYQTTMSKMSNTLD